MGKMNGEDQERSREAHKVITAAFGNERRCQGLDLMPFSQNQRAMFIFTPPGGKLARCFLVLGFQFALHLGGHWTSDSPAGVRLRGCSRHGHVDSQGLRASRCLTINSLC